MEPGPDQPGAGKQAKPQPFNVQHNLHKTSFDSTTSSASDCCSAQGSAASASAAGGICTCGSLTGWSSMQLQEQHLLGACSRSPQDMFVVVLTNGEHPGEASSIGGEQQKKPRASVAGSQASSAARAGRQSCLQSLFLQMSCEQTPRQLTQEYCLRLVALLLVVLATVGLAYRLSRRDS